MSSRVQGSEVRNLHLFMTHDTSGESATIVYCIQNSNAYLNDTTDCCTDILSNSSILVGQKSRGCNHQEADLL